MKGCRECAYSSREGGENMKKRYSQLISIQNDHPVTQSTDPAFWFHLQYSLLLAMKEQGVINMVQLRHADDKLNRKRSKTL